jgi:hypothetical protein
MAMMDKSSLKLIGRMQRRQSNSGIEDLALQSCWFRKQSKQKAPAETRNRLAVTKIAPSRARAKWNSFAFGRLGECHSVLETPLCNSDCANRQISSRILFAMCQFILLRALLGTRSWMFGPLNLEKEFIFMLLNSSVHWACTLSTQQDGSEINCHVSPPEEAFSQSQKYSHRICTCTQVWCHRRLDRDKVYTERYHFGKWTRSRG